jgi:hypothetical protein
LGRSSGEDRVVDRMADADQAAARATLEVSPAQAAKKKG